MHNTESTSQQAAEPREMRIELWRDHRVTFEGTAAQLQAEGLIPPGFEWPKARADKRWEAGGLCFWLRRARPEGHKGLMRTWLELDNWRLIYTVKGRDARWESLRYIERKADELRAQAYLLTAAGAAERDASWSRFWATLEDKSFQAFKARVPGLIPPKRGRRAQGPAQ